MALAKIINLFALSTLAVFLCNVAIEPANAVSIEAHGMSKMRRAHVHDAMAKRKRSNSKRCRTRSSTLGASSTPAAPASSADTTPAPAPTTDSPPASSAAPASSAPPASSSPSGSGATGTGKIGLAWGGAPDQLAGVITPNVQYMYNWDSRRPDGSENLPVKYMPMLWSNSGDRVSTFQSTVVPGYAEYVLGFNEIDQTGQANMDVGSTVAAWKQYIQPLASQGYKLLAPVTSSAPVGFDMITQFEQQCDGCTIDGYTVHYYGTSGTDMINYITKWHDQFQKDIWVTEFACQNYNTANENNGQQCSNDQIWDFYKTVIDFMESTPWVTAYFPFGFMYPLPDGVNPADGLMNPDGSLTDLGRAIVNRSL